MRPVAPERIVSGDPVAVHAASPGDLEAIRRIYNEGVEDRVATLDVEPKSAEQNERWWDEHDARYPILVAIESEQIVGWASLNRFSHRCAHADIADLSVYVARARRGKGIGYALLRSLIGLAKSHGFHKIVLHAIDSNAQGKRLYRKSGFAEVGVLKEHGRVDGNYVDVVVMERLLR